MPRRTLARRFEPRYGVSETMIETESTYVARELADYLHFSVNDLTERLSNAHATIDQAEEQLQTVIGSLPDRERLALRCLLARDLWHIAKLYLKTLEQSPHVQASGTTSHVSEELTGAEEPRPLLAFKNSLFE
jgi:hypothetical protein